MSSSQRIKQWVVMAGVILLSGCATVNTQHPMVMNGDITPELKNQLATVYFIRPEAYKTKGVANDTVRITFQGKTLLTLDEGAYTLLYMKPSKGVLRVYSKTQFINSTTPVEVYREREYKFIANKTYFVYVRQINEEFRGVYYDPQPVTLAEAKELIKPGPGRFGSTRPSGLARSAPIDELEEEAVNPPPSSAVKGLAPALPEHIYKREKYLHKVK
ncbi:MAG TPA: hypothetical protein ENI97_04850 [Gammaproteobacteria bacterium]|nr:hypothetical protein [Gammaproteobacteria bacterium]